MAAAVALAVALLLATITPCRAHTPRPSCGAATPTPYTLVWHAPVLSGGGYGSEAIEYITAIDRLLAAPTTGLKESCPVSEEANPAAAAGAVFHPRVASLAVVQHGDAASAAAVDGMPPALQRLLRRVMTNPSLRWGASASAGALVVVCHSEPGAWAVPRSLFETEPCPPLRGRPHALTIGRTMFETDRLPAGWAARLNAVDEVWVPTAFHVDTFTAGGVPPSRLHVVPEAIDPTFWDPAKFRGGFFDGMPPLRMGRWAARRSAPVRPGEPSDGCRFRFLSVFKWEPRKGWDVLLDAFFQEFSSSEKGAGVVEKNEGPDPFGGDDTADVIRDSDVCLYIKTAKYHTGDDDDEYRFETMEEVAALFRRRFGRNWRLQNQPRVRILSAHVPRAEYPNLFRSVDCVVQPSRGEGWGRPHMEGMAMGVLVIATNWSGNTAFMRHEENALLIPVERMSVIEEGAFKGHRWAEPSVAGLRALMRRAVVEHASPAMAALRQRARAEIATRFSDDAVARLIVDRVEFLLRRKFGHGDTDAKGQR